MTDKTGARPYNGYWFNVDGKKQPQRVDSSGQSIPKKLTGKVKNKKRR